MSKTKVEFLRQRRFHVAVKFFLNGAEVEFKDLFFYFCLVGFVVLWSLTQEVASSNDIFEEKKLSLNSLKKKKTSKIYLRKYFATHRTATATNKVSLSKSMMFILSLSKEIL